MLLLLRSKESAYASNKAADSVESNVLDVWLSFRDDPCLRRGHETERLVMNNVNKLTGVCDLI
jgi:hypothetical protein